MKKRIIAIIALAALIIGLLAGLIPAVSAAENDRFLVGYSKQDVNPWIKSAYTGDVGIVKTFTDNIVTVKVTDPADSTKTIDQEMIAVPLSGYADPLKRLSNTITDDNGDGKVGLGDGIFTTCTAVSDQIGTTMLYITMDALHTYDIILAEIRERIPAAIKTATGGRISGDHIMFSTSHTHEGPELDYLVWYGDENPSWKAYYDYVVDQIVKAAVEAYSTRTEAAMYKSEVDAKAATAVLGKNNGKGLQMNAVRHYYMRNGYGGTRVFVGGNEFNSISGQITTPSGVHNYQSGNVPYGKVAESNDTMYLLEFVPTDGADSIVLVNWRAHPSFLGGSTQEVLSSDYINALRYYLEKLDYRVAFFQGAAGNINPRDLYDSDSWHKHTEWASAPSNETNAQFITRAGKNCRIYGQLLGEIAHYGLKNAMGSELSGGTIRIKHQVYKAAKAEGTETINQPIDVMALGPDVMIVIGAGEYFDRYDSNYTTSGKAYKEVVTYGKATKSVWISVSWKHVATAVDPSNPPQFSVVTDGNGKIIAEKTDTATDVSGYSIDNVEYNEWLTLNDEDTYGTPFFFGYSSAHNKYVPNSMAFDYNDNLSSTLGSTPALDDGTVEPFQKNSYEAESKSCNNMKRGEGEKIIATMAQMVKVVADETGYKIGECKHCGITTTWEPLKAAFGEALSISSGHYYLTQDFIGENVRGKTVSGNVCIDINDKTFAPTYQNNSGVLRGAPFIVEAGAELSVMDNGEDTQTIGTLIGAGDGDYPGGVVSVFGKKAVFNLYDCNMQFTGEAATVNYGGAVYVKDSGTFNMYGGTVQGGTVGGDGGTLYVSSEANANIYSGKLIAGNADAHGDCVYLASGSACIRLENNASVDEIMFSAANANTDYFGNMLVSGKYTGTAKITLDPARTKFYSGMNIGKSENAVIPAGAITYTHNDGVIYEATVSGTNLKLTKAVTGFVITDTNGNSGASNEYFSTVLDSYNAGGDTPETATHYIKLLKDMTENVTINKDVYLDLNGHQITGNITVERGKTLYCMDSRTDDYDIEDGNGYAVITGTVTGNIQGVPAGSPISPDENRGAGHSAYHAGYLKIVEKVGGVTQTSFHRVDLGLVYINFKPDDLGMSYTSNFSGDQLVKKHVKGFGVAASIQESPNAENLETKCGYSTLEGFEAGRGVNVGKSTRLINIMLPTNSQITNKNNSEKKVYGKAYLLTDEGYTFGTEAVKTLKETVEAADTYFAQSNETLQQNAVNMYETFEKVMSKWNVKNIKAAANKEED